MGYRTINSRIILQRNVQQMKKLLLILLVAGCTKEQIKDTIPVQPSTHYVRPRIKLVSDSLVGFWRSHYYNKIIEFKSTTITEQMYDNSWHIYNYHVDSKNNIVRTMVQRKLVGEPFFSNVKPFTDTIKDCNIYRDSLWTKDQILHIRSK